MTNKNCTLTQERLKELLHYDSDTGVFTWKVSRQGVKGIGAVAGSKALTGYIVIRINGKMYYAHRLSWLYVHGYFPEEIDHINHKRADNRIKNLSGAGSLENKRNRPMQSNNSSGITGVSWSKKREKWYAYIKIKGKQICLGFFDELSDAANARKDADRKHGFHANHGASVSEG